MFTSLHINISKKFDFNYKPITYIDVINKNMTKWSKYEFLKF